MGANKFASVDELGHCGGSKSRRRRGSHIEEEALK